MSLYAEQPWRVYDQPIFFEKYCLYRTQPCSPNNQLEQPTIKSLLPSLRGKTVLDIGCGFGDFCRYAAEQEASHVLGIDPSLNMYKMACSKNPGNQVSYKNIAVEYFETKETFDVIVSSLAFHYVERFDETISRVASWLNPKGFLVFSVNHPNFTVAMAGTDENSIGTGQMPYFQEGPRLHIFLGEKVVKYHRILQTYYKSIQSAGIKIIYLKELSTPPGNLHHLSKLNLIQIQPMFIIFAGIKET